MTEDTTAQLREQIADIVAGIDIHDRSGWEVATVLTPIILAQVEAAKATARRDALLEAADEMFNEVEGGPGLLRPEVQDWLRWRASAQGAAPAEACNFIADWMRPSHCFICNEPETAHVQRPGGQSSGHEYTSPAFGVDRCCVVVAMSGGERDMPIPCGKSRLDPIHQATPEERCAIGITGLFVRHECALPARHPGPCRQATPEEPS